ncbi:sensor histidine kinase [Trichocoleus sp. FACHB-591]|uniref:sensor histidine kinase n=1 Tax=Trichocoleus sp. FACHB-591 TaxID=2692872 RepID=UPI00168609A7|nr:sensor histidine kinase [Trichocoleus sp. FACHB-591]MBD2098917.1 sensor histidine kinase [Trichocoleus sp. FACHB-591]
MANQESSQTIAALQQELEQTRLAYQMAVEMHQFKSGFLARVSHELRSPLNGLIGMHQLILSDLCDDPAEERDFLGQANQSALNLMQLLDLILDVARLEHGSRQIQLQPLKLGQILQEVYNLTHLQARDRNIRLKLLPIQEDIYVQADPKWLQQTLVSLLDTSIRLTPEGTISLSATVQPETEQVTICIEAPYAVSLWSEPAQLLSNQALPTAPNTPAALSPGLALLMHQSVIERMQGRLEIIALPSEPDSNANPTDATESTRIQCLMPLVMPETDLA